MMVLKIDPSKCTGCMSCAMACSLRKFGECNPHKAAIRVKRDEFERYELPLVCVHCDDAACLEYCPQNAYVVIDNIIYHNNTKCILCGMCSLLCPNQGINFTGDEIIKCDLCSGDPLCVKFCSTKAVEFVKAEDLPQESRDEHVSRVLKSKRTGIESE